MKFKKLLFIILIMILSSLLILKIYNLNNDLDQNETLIHFIDVGQGDCILIQNHKYNIVIDGGSNTSKDKVISYLKKYNVKEINYYIYSHPHEDHIGSSDDIISKFKVRNVIGPKVSTSSEEFFNLVKSIKKKRLKIHVPNNSSNIHLSENEYIHILYNGDYKSDNINNNSLVFKYINNNLSVLFTGDMEKEIENMLLSKNSNLSSEIIKIAHHGSKTSTTSEFLSKVDPSIAIISCGMGNEYGHPNRSVLESLENINCETLRTDISGNIILSIKNSKIQLYKEKQD